MRPTGMALCIIGFYLLFIPIIKLLSWIPLVGWLISSLASLAAILFALIVGLTISTTVIAVAWLFYRPLIGIPLLLFVSTVVHLVWFYDWSTPELVQEETILLDPVPMATELSMVSRAVIKSTIG